MRILVASIILLLASSCYPYPVMAQSPVKQITITKTYFCSNHEYVVNDLEKNYGEARKGWAVSNKDGMVELFVNDHTGQWTVIFSNPNGLTCGLIGGMGGFTFDVDNPSGNKL